MRIYFIHDGTSEKGPFNIDDLKLQPLKKETPIWYEGLGEWTTAIEVDEVKSFFNSIPPPLHKKPHSFSVSVDSENQLHQNTDDGKKKKIIKFSLVIVGILSVICIMGWLIYESKKSEQNQKEITEQLIEQQQKTIASEDEAKRKEEAQKEIERNIQAKKDNTNAANTEKFMGYRNNWQNFITVSNEPYNVNSLGGISDLIITVNNNTDKMVDEVQVIVSYITSGGKVWQRETLSVTNIAPNNSKSVTAPSSDRGSSVTEEIISITAKSFHFCYPSGMIDNKNFDPYFCK